MRIAPVHPAINKNIRPSTVSKNLSFQARNSSFFGKKDEFTVTVNGEKMVPVHPNINAPKEALERFASCVWDFDDDTLNNIVYSCYGVRCEDSDINKITAKPEKIKDKMQDFSIVMYPYVENVRKAVYNDAPFVAGNGGISVLSRQAYISSKENIYYSFFNILKGANGGECSYDNVPRGIVLTGESKENKENLKNWIASYGAKKPLNINYVKVKLDGDLKNNFNVVKNALINALNLHKENKQYTVIELENFSDVINSSSDNYEFQIFKSKMKSFIEEANLYFSTFLVEFDDAGSIPSDFIESNKFQIITNCGIRGLTKEQNEQYRARFDRIKPYLLNTLAYEQKYLVPWEGCELQSACKIAEEIQKNPIKEEKVSIFSKIMYELNDFLQDMEKNRLGEDYNDRMKDLLGEFWYEDY